MALAHHYLPLKYLGHHRCMWSVGYSGGVFPNQTILSFFSKRQQFPLPSQCEEEDTTSFFISILEYTKKISVEFE